MKFSCEEKINKKELEMLKTVSGIDYVIIIVEKVCKSFISIHNINQLSDRFFYTLVNRNMSLKLIVLQC